MDKTKRYQELVNKAFRTVERRLKAAKSWRWRTVSVVPAFKFNRMPEIGLCYGGRVFDFDFVDMPARKPTHFNVKGCLPHYELPVYVQTMRTYKELNKDDFKRIWIETAIGNDIILAFLGGNAKLLGKNETLETLAVEHDLSKFT